MPANIRIGFSRSTAFSSRLIRWVTRSRVSHAFLVFDDPVFGPNMVLDAEPGGYTVKTWKRFTVTDNNTPVWMVRPQVLLDTGFRQMATALEDGYSYAGAIGLLETILGRRLGKRLRNPLSSKRKLFCSQAVAMTMQLSGYPGLEAVDPGSLSPDDLLTLLQKDTRNMGYIP